MLNKCTVDMKLEHLSAKINSKHTKEKLPFSYDLCGQASQFHIYPFSIVGVSALVGVGAFSGHCET